MDSFMDLFNGVDPYTGPFALAVALFVVGLLLIMIGGDRFVDASIVISNKLGIPQIIVGATIVSLGTTLPEILTSTTAAIGGKGDMAMGNAFGSIVCNTALIAAVTQLCKPSHGVERSSITWRTILFFAAYALVAGLGLTGVVPRWAGAVLLIGFVVYAVLSIKLTGNEDTGEDSSKDGEEGSIAVAAITMVVCAAMLFLGARFLVNCGTVIAKHFNAPQAVISVIFIALGTSLPELVTAITALVKGYEDVSLGNIIGANTLNLLLVIGIPAAIQNGGITVYTAADTGAKNSFFLTAPTGAIVMLLLLLPFFFKKRGYRWQGMALLAVYAAYTALQIVWVG